MSMIDRLVAAHARVPHPDQHAHGRLLMGDIPTRGDHELTPAAVLVAITDRAEPGVLFIQRPDTMRKHAGQIAFPGGRVDPEDADTASAALREAHEEIGLDPALPRLLGSADPYRTLTSYEITPVFALIPPDLPLVANPHEVDAIYEVPLAFLLDPANHAQVDVDWEGHKRHYYEMIWNDLRIWGATAGMIVNMTRRLTWHG